MKKALKYIGILLVVAIISFLVYRVIYTMYSGPSDEELKEQKVKDDTAAESKLDALDASFEEVDSTTTDSIAN